LIAKRILLNFNVILGYHKRFIQSTPKHYLLTQNNFNETCKKLICILFIGFNKWFCLSKVKDHFNMIMVCFAQFVKASSFRIKRRWNIVHKYHSILFDHQQITTSQNKAKPLVSYRCSSLYIYISLYIQFN